MLLVVGVASTTLGTAYWQHIGFTFEGLWFENGLRLHPLHLVAAGLFIVPPTMLDVFLLEASRPEQASSRALPDDASG